MNIFRTKFLACALVLTGVFSGVVNAAVNNAITVCPYTYLFELNGDHYYAACECNTPVCLEVPIEQILIFDQQVQKLGCDPPAAIGGKCVCETKLVAKGGILNLGDLSNQANELTCEITRDAFVVSQHLGQPTYFRALTFSARNDKTGRMEECSIAIPLTQKSVTDLVQNGISGQPVVFHESRFDGIKVNYGGTSFASIVRNQAVQPKAKGQRTMQVSHTQ